MKIDKLKEYRNKKIAILWFWKEGKSTLNFLQKLWFTNIFILDKNQNIEKVNKIHYTLWKKYLDNIWDFFLIFKTPWFSPYNKELLDYKNKIISQIQIFFNNYRWKVIWITWTKWKSTTSTLAYETLKKIWYNTKLVWNIWTPVLDEINILENESHDFIIYELSSYMLEWININPYIGVINNLYDCHLDWHNWRENYHKAKLWVIKNSTYKLVNYELKNYIQNDSIKFFWENWDYSYKNKMFYKSDQSILVDENILLKWEHNRKNISVIIWILDIIKSEKLVENIKMLKSILSSFWWLEHRLEDIWIYKWITFIDDAIATTPESTIAALKTYKNDIWTIFLWWEDSGFSFIELRNILQKYNILNIVLFPDTWEKIFWDLSMHNYDTEFILEWEYRPKIFKTRSMKNAVKFAYKNTPKWKICILSNAAPSFSLWSWYIEKWEQFKNEVKNHN